MREQRALVVSVRDWARRRGRFANVCPDSRWCEWPWQGGESAALWRQMGDLPMPMEKCSRIVDVIHISPLSQGNTGIKLGYPHASPQQSLRPGNGTSWARYCVRCGRSKDSLKRISWAGFSGTVGTFLGMFTDSSKTGPGP